MDASDRWVEHDGIYLLSHSVGLPLRGARAAAAEYVEVWEQDPEHAWPSWLAAVDEFRASLARLLATSPASICPQSNLSSGLTKVLGGLRDGFEQPILLLSEEAFPSLGYVASHAGFDVRFVPRDEDATDPAVWEAHLDESVDVVLVTHVHSNTGELVPTPAIIEAARRLGVVSIIDVAQSAGIIPIDLAAWGADVVLGSCVKWLSGGPGAGWLWVHPEMIERCTPTDVGWWSHEDPFEFDIHTFRYADDALRFWGGTPTVSPFIVARHAIDVIGAIGVDAARDHNTELVDRLIDGLGDRVVSPHEIDRRSGTCVVAGTETEAAMLGAVGVAIDHRANGIRLSPHLHTDVADIDRVVALLSA